MLITIDANEFEVIPGHSIYANDVQGVPQGVYLSWEHLTDDQRVKFRDAHDELTQAVANLQDVFSTEFVRKENTCRG